MLVQKGDVLTRLEKRKHIELYVTYSVVMADEEYFLLAVRVPKVDENNISYIHTDLDNLSLYSNREEINTLEDLKFEKLEKEV